MGARKRTHAIFGEFIDKYLLPEAELDGATVPILYEGRTADGLVKDAPGLDELFEDMFRDYEPDELAIIKAKYATEGDVLEAPLLIEQKARDMIRHDVGVVLPEGFKAQVVATSRQAAVTYGEKLEQARRELVAELEAVPPATLALSDEEVEKLDANTRFLVRTYPLLGKLRALEMAVVISGDHNDPESWWDWADKSKQKERITRFKRKLASEKTDKTDPLSILVVNNMLLSGFDAPVEQVLYLDRKSVCEVADREAAEEEQRLLYVALTRARARVVLPYFGPVKGKAVVATGDPGGRALAAPKSGPYTQLNAPLRRIVEGRAGGERNG
jgi:type I restriction enzyme R subunit